MQQEEPVAAPQVYITRRLPVCSKEIKQTPEERDVGGDGGKPDSLKTLSHEHTHTYTITYTHTVTKKVISPEREEMIRKSILLQK